MAQIHGTNIRFIDAGSTVSTPQAKFLARRTVRIWRNRQGIFLTIQLTFEYYQFVLKVEIENRKKLKKDFLETEIWYLLFNIVRAGQKFQLFKKKIGNIHPNNILINENGQVKVISSCSLPGELNNYDLLLQSQHDKDLIVFLAPE